MQNKIKYLLFDAANTLIHKPILWTNILQVLNKFGYSVDKNKLIYNHKFLSETINFPDRTNKDFYTTFNTELLNSMAIEATPEIISHLFEKCSYLPWEKFNDLEVLNSIELPKAILSNFNSTLSEIINKEVNVKFETIISSEKEGVRKPNVEFYKLAVQKLEVKPEEILYIGDSLKLDYIPAKQVGMNALIIDRVNFYPDLAYCINDFSQIVKHLN